MLDLCGSMVRLYLATTDALISLCWISIEYTGALNKLSITGRPAD